MRLLLSILFCLLLSGVDAQPKDIPYVNKEFLIIFTSKDYNAVLKKATLASKKLKLQLDLRGLKPEKNIGLTQSEMVCENECDFYPCYVPRAKGKDDIYISIEYSDAYIDLETAMYMVVASCYVKEDKKNTSLLLKVKKIYKEAVLKTSKVFTDCIH